MRFLPAPAARAWRRAGVVTALTLTGVLATVAPASASVPEGWDTAESVSGLQFLLVLLVFPLVAFLVIWVLAHLAASRPPRYAKAVELHQGQTWMGGPQKGVQAATGTSAEETGGASARW